MKNLDYKGWKSTRVQIGIFLFIAATILFATQKWTGAQMTAQDWINFVEWLFGIYCASEVGAKGAEAVASK